MTPKLYVSFLSIVLFSSNAISLEISDPTPYGFMLSGEVVEGDAEKFIEAYAAAFGMVASGAEGNKGWGSLDTVIVQGPGGDLIEAMKIGRFIRAAHIKTIAAHQCASSCFFILAAGIERDSSGAQIGFHRPRFSQNTYKQMSPDQGVIQQKLLQDASREYLVEMEIPENLIDDIFTIASNEVRWVNGLDVRDRMGMVTPGLGEWYAANCGALSTQEKYDIDKYDGAISCKRIREHNQTGHEVQLPEFDYCPSAERYFAEHSSSYWDFLNTNRNRIEECSREHMTTARLVLLVNWKMKMESLENKEGVNSVPE